MLCSTPGKRGGEKHQQPAWAYRCWPYSLSLLAVQLGKREVRSDVKQDIEHREETDDFPNRESVAPEGQERVSSGIAFRQHSARSEKEVARC